MTTMEQIRNEVLGLSASERACLAHELLLSLDSPDSLTFSPQYENELQARTDKVRTGSAKGRDAEVVFAELKRHLAECKSNS